MNIDERLEALTQTVEKLAEKVGALTESVELLAGIHKDNEKASARLGKYVRSVMQMVLDHETRLRSIEGDDEPDTQ
jgi:hypothetical protein